MVNFSKFFRIFLLKVLMKSKGSLGKIVKREGN